MVPPSSMSTSPPVPPSVPRSKLSGECLGLPPPLVTRSQCPLTYSHGSLPRLPPQLVAWALHFLMEPQLESELTQV